MKPQTDKHTPTPWGVQHVPWGREIDHKIVSALGQVIAILNKPRLGIEHNQIMHDADFIVRAVNSHEALLEAAKQLIQEVRASDIITGYTGFINLKKAIAKTEGGK